jgi:hypothetical protein
LPTNDGGAGRSRHSGGTVTTQLLKATLAIAVIMFGFDPAGGASQNPPMAPPSAEISNGQLRARLYLPDAQRVFYRSTRFDWSGVIAGLKYKEHEFYAPWFTKTDPAVHDFVYKDADIVASAQSAMVGPAEEFSRPQGYSTAKPGGTFIKIGVGVLRKSDDSNYSAYNNYELLDAGTWTVNRKPDSLEFTQDLTDSSSGYGYVYRKTVRLTKGKPELVLQHSLKNTGKKIIESSVYEHNFWVIDKQPTGPDFTVTFPFDAKNIARAATARGRHMVSSGSDCIQYMKPSRGLRQYIG